jgi:hypothetical protein
MSITWAEVEKHGYKLYRPFDQKKEGRMYHHIINLRPNRNAKIMGWDKIQMNQDYQNAHGALIFLYISPLSADKKGGRREKQKQKKTLRKSNENRSKLLSPTQRSLEQKFFWSKPRYYTKEISLHWFKLQAQIR